MSKINTLKQSVIELAQEVGNAAPIAFMATAALMGTVQFSEGREKALVPAVAALTPFADLHDTTPVNTDQTLRREKESEVGAHGAIYTVSRSTPSRAAGKH